MADEEAYWEISGPRRYLNIPTVSPDRWRAQMTFGNFPNYREVVGWGPTEDDAKIDAARKAVAEDAEKPACEHELDDTPSWNYCRCKKCGWIKTGWADWHIARNQWFPSVEVAKFYEKNGRLPEPLTTAESKG